MDLELQFAVIGPIRTIERGQQRRNRAVEVAVAQRHATFGHQHPELFARAEPVSVRCPPVPVLPGLGEARCGTLGIGQADVRLGQIGEQAPDELRRVHPCEVDGAPTQTDRFEMFTRRPRMRARFPSTIASMSGRPSASLTAERVLVGADRPVVVGHRLIHRRDGVQDATLVDDVVGGPVHLEGLQTVIEGVRVVAGLVVDDTDEMQRPRERQADLVGFGQFDRLRRQGERILGTAALVRDRGQLVQRLGLVGTQTMGSSQHSGVECELTSPIGIGSPTLRRLVEERSNLLLLGSPCRRRIQHSGTLTP